MATIAMEIALKKQQDSNLYCLLRLNCRLQLSTKSNSHIELDDSYFRLQKLTIIAIANCKLKV